MVKTFLRASWDWRRRAEKSTSDPKMEGNSRKGGSFDELTHNILERKGDEESDDENESRLLFRIKPANDVLKNDSHDNDTKGYADPRPGDNQESNKDEDRRSNLYNVAIDEAREKALKKENTLNPHMHPASDVEDDDSKNSESSPALKPLPEMK